MQTKTSTLDKRQPQPEEATPEITTETLSDPIQDAIRVRAYELYQERGRQDGHALEDWIRAEAEIRASLATEGSAAA